jgi:Ulp1 family protease
VELSSDDHDSWSEGSHGGGGRWWKNLTGLRNSQHTAGEWIDRARLLSEGVHSDGSIPILPMLLLLDDCKRFAPAQFITCTALIEYFKLVNQVQASANRGNACWFVSPDFLNLVSAPVSERSKVKIAGLSRTVDVPNLSKIMFPVNWFDTHWGLYFVDLQQSNFGYYDSCKSLVSSGLITERLGVIKTYLADLWCSLNLKSVGFAEWTFSEPKVPQQNNQMVETVDCAVFTAHFGRRLALGGTFDMECSNSVDNRLRMLAEMLAGKLFDDNE